MVPPIIVVHCSVDLQSVHGFSCCDSIEPNAKCQRVLVLALCLVKAKFHYAILVADRSEAGRRPVADMLARASSC